MNQLTEPDWKSVADNFWYACFHGDFDLMDHMVEKYTPYFDEDEDEEDDEEDI